MPDVSRPSRRGALMQVVAASGPAGHGAGRFGVGPRAARTGFRSPVERGRTYRFAKELQT